MTRLRSLALLTPLLTACALLVAVGIAPAQQNKLIGSITSVDAGAGTFSVAESDGSRTMDFRVDKNSRVSDRVTHKAVKLEDLAVDSSVSVTYADPEDGVALVRHMEVSAPRRSSSE